MHVGNRITSVAGMALLLLNVAAAQGQTTAAVEFVDITDAVAGRFFDAAATEADPADGNKLVIRFNTGRDPATWKANDFRASTAAFSHLSAMDTINFKIVPPAGHYVAKVTYTQQGHRIDACGLARPPAARTGSSATTPRTWARMAATRHLSIHRCLRRYWPILPVLDHDGPARVLDAVARVAAVAITAAEVVVELAESIRRRRRTRSAAVVESDPADKR